MDSEKDQKCVIPCNICMLNAPYRYCCRFECGEHEFCNGCTWRPLDSKKTCNL